MAKLIYRVFYGLPLQSVVGYMVLLIFLWMLIEYIVYKKHDKRILWKVLNIVAFLGILSAIMLVTLSSRASSVRTLILTPFRSFVEARTQPELYRSMLMNVFLFFPLGLTLPYVLPDKWKHQALLAIIFALILSVVIEFTQYSFHLGRAETDDVICNTLGCAIGTISYLLNQTFKKTERDD